jgi:hypothetical protein
MSAEGAEVQRIFRRCWCKGVLKSAEGAEVLKVLKCWKVLKV